MMNKRIFLTLFLILISCYANKDIKKEIIPKESSGRIVGDSLSNYSEPQIINGFHVISDTAKQTISLTDLFNKMKNSIVVIYTYDYDDEPLNQGTGAFINNEGDLITNWHILEDAYTAQIKLFNGTSYFMDSILAADFENDLAIVSINSTNDKFQYITFDTKTPDFGEQIITIGNPLGLDFSISDGIISSIREIHGYGNIYQISAPISPGSSGSPVINLSGNVIGIATFQLLEGQNINFAISSEVIIKMKSDYSGTLSQLYDDQFEEWWTSDDNFILQSIYYYADNKIDEAIEILENALYLNTDNSFGYYLLGTCYSEKEEYKKAIDAYNYSLTIDPRYSWAHNDIACAYYEINDIAASYEHIKTALDIDPEFEDAYTNLGLVQNYFGNYQSALDACYQALSINSQCAEAYNNIGCTFVEMDNYYKAKTAFDSAINIDPDDEKYYYNRGIANYNLNNLHEAINDFNKSIEIKPEYADTYSNLVMTYVEIQDYKEALSVINKALEFDIQDYFIYYTQGLIYFYYDNFNDALVAINNCLKINPNPDDCLTHTLLGKIYYELNKYSNAADACDIALTINSECVEAYITLGNINVMTDNIDNAINMFNKALQLDQDNIDALYYLGVIHYSLGDTEMGYEYYYLLNKLDTEYGDQLLDVFIELNNQ